MFKTTIFNEMFIVRCFLSIRCVSSLQKLVSWQTLTWTPAVCLTRKSEMHSWRNITSFLVRKCTQCVSSDQPLIGELESASVLLLLLPAITSKVHWSDCTHQIVMTKMTEKFIRFLNSKLQWMEILKSKSYKKSRFSETSSMKIISCFHPFSTYHALSTLKPM